MIYTIKAASVKRELPDGKFGPAIVYNLSLEGEDGKGATADWFTKTSTPAPQVGDKLEGDVVPNKFGNGFDFKKAQAGGAFGGGGGPRPSDPKQLKSIQGQVAVKAAVDIARIALESGQSTAAVFATVEQNAQKLAKLIDELAA